MIMLKWDEWELLGPVIFVLTGQYSRNRMRGFISTEYTGDSSFSSVESISAMQVLGK